MGDIVASQRQGSRSVTDPSSRDASALSSRARASGDSPRVLIAGAFLSAATGIRYVCEELADGLRSRGWQVLTTSAVEPRVPRLLDMLATVWLKRPLFDVAQVDVYSGPAFVWAEAVSASLIMLRCPFVVTVHSGALPEFAARWPTRVRRLLRAASVVTSPSAYLQEQLRPYRSDVRVVHNGLHLDRYLARDPGPASPRLVWIRTYEQRYNPLLALQVVQRLAVDYPRVELVMVGPDAGDWSAAQQLEEAARLGVDGRVDIRGPVDKTDIPRILRRGDIFLNTTNVDNAPVTVVEAMACGLCVVSTDAGGVSKLVRDGIDGLLVPRGDPEAMAAAVARILREPDLARRLSRNARRKAQTFAWTRVLPEWEMLLSAVAGKRP